MRRNRPQKRKILADPLYSSKLVARFINMIMLDGKKSLAEDVVYGAIEELGKRTGKDNPLEVFQKAIENVKPLVEVKSRRVGGATYQVPIEVRSDRSLTLALRWIRDFSRSKKGPDYTDPSDSIFYKTGQRSNTGYTPYFTANTRTGPTMVSGTVGPYRSKISGLAARIKRVLLPIIL